jgi:spore maturation protein CgeB
MLFDHVFVWHKSFVALYEAAGHPKVYAMPHAVDACAYKDSEVESERPLDVGWVGRFAYGHYARRKRIIGGLASRFKLNDFTKEYSKLETAGVYRQSKIVVNVSRDEFPQEANMRCYEAMGAGALLVTQIPTELTEWGFREGEHFVGWRSESEIPAIVHRYIHNENERLGIARAGRDLTMSGFTFQHCRDRMIAVLREHQNQFYAPARSWPAEKLSLTYLEYYYRYNCLDAAFEEFAILRKADRKSYWKGLPMMLKMLRHKLRVLR